MLITELCKKMGGGKSEQYFILLFSFQVDFIASAGAVLTAITLYCSHELHFSGFRAPVSLCILSTTLQKSTLYCQEKLAGAKERGEKKGRSRSARHKVKS